MKFIIFLWLLLCFCKPDLSAQKTYKAIFVIADGIPADVIERLKTPAFTAISKEGGYARAFVGGEKDGFYAFLFLYCVCDEKFNT